LGTGRGAESFGGTDSVGACVVGGATGGGVLAAAESVCFVGGGTAGVASRDLLTSDAATVSPPMSSAPAIQ
jgi:hypothetical protein